MTKNTSPTDPGKMTLFKKFKHFDPLEHSLGILGFILAAALFLGCYFYLDFRAVTQRVHYNGVPPSLPSSTDAEAITYGGGMFQQQGFLDEGGEGCDIFDGKWVWDDSYPFYNSKDCIFIDEGFRCLENGRPDSFFTKWRWQPKDCTLPRFDARNMLEKLRNRRVVFAGDSIGRDQWQSLVCMLASAISNKSAIYDRDGNPVTKKGFFAMFNDYNFTVEYFKAPYLVVQGSPPKGAPEGVKLTVRVDKMAWTSNKWRDADMLVLNSAHWWTFEKTIRSGCYFQERNEVRMDMSIETAFQRSIETLLDWLGSEVNLNKTQVFFRTYSPMHFRGGDWKTGGHCHLTKLPDFASTINVSEEHFNIVADVLSNRSNEPQVMNLDFLNVTYMTARRNDGHPSLYGRKNRHGLGPLDHQDCSHWCLPGVPDSWNELLYALFLKRESVRLQNSIKPSQDPL